MKPLDQFKRTPFRRYDKAPPPPPEEKRTLEPAIRKRYFGVPSFERMHAGRWLGGAICAAMLLTLCSACPVRRRSRTALWPRRPVSTRIRRSWK